MPAARRAAKAKVGVRSRMILSTSSGQFPGRSRDDTDVYAVIYGGRGRPSGRLGPAGRYGDLSFSEEHCGEHPAFPRMPPANQASLESLACLAEPACKVRWLTRNSSRDPILRDTLEVVENNGSAQLLR